MKRFALSMLTGALGAGLLLASPEPALAQRHAPPPQPYKKVSGLVALPDFVPGLGTLYVNPATLPAGPFLAYDHHGNLVSSIYMIPISEMSAHKDFTNLAVAHERVDHVDVMFNAGHPGVQEPHYHIILWYVSPARAAELAH